LFKAAKAEDLLNAVISGLGQGLIKDSRGFYLTSSYGSLEEGAEYQFEPRPGEALLSLQ
jgi:hypothetical protein